MPTDITSESSDGVMLVGASDGCDDYILWQGPSGYLDRSEIHFEWNDQSTGGHKIVKIVQECSVDRDGVHIVLSDSRLVHFYFRGLDKRDWCRFQEGLEELYSESPDVLVFHY